MNNGEILDQLRLTGERLYLRSIEPSDVDGVYLDWLNDPDVTRFLYFVHERQTRETVLRYLKRFEDSDTDIIYAICENQTDRHIGNVTINNINRFHGTADTGLMLGDKDFWGQGYAFEAWHLILDFAFTQLNLRKLVAGSIVDNFASIKTMEKLGFKREGVFRQEAMVDEEYCDVIRFGLFHDELLDG